MLARKHYKIRSTLQDQGVIFCYSGYMTEAILSGLGQALKQKMILDDTDSRTVRSVFGIFVEQMQNVIRYSADREPDTSPENSVLSYGLLTIGREADAYYIACGNKVKSEDVPSLDAQLQLIQSMNRQELKEHYKKILKGDTPATSKGAGVGFVDIAKKASRPIEFDFMELDNEHAYFSLKAFV